jgi:sugar lactone lactonase YvrE
MNGGQPAAPDPHPAASPAGDERRPDLRVLMEGRGLVESARWHDGRFWFADWTAGEVIAIDLDGRGEVVARVDSLPLCFDWLPDGRLVVVDARQRRLLVKAHNGPLAPYADLAPLSEFGSNDIAVDSRGNVFVNNVNFAFPGGEPRPGFVAVATADGQVRRVAEDVMFPNGMRVTADDRTLIVAESYAGRLTAFDIGDDGSLSGRRMWAP